MSDEPKSDGHVPDPLSDFFPNRGADAFEGSTPAPLVPAEPQFTSRREARNAGTPARRPVNSKTVKSKTVKSKAANRTAATAPATRTTKLSRRDQAAVKKLAATPKIVAAPTPKSKQKKQNPVKVFFVLLVIAGFVGGVALPAAASGNPLGGGSVATSYKHAQSAKISASIQTSKVSRDAVSATSEAELRTEQINARYLADVSRVRQPGDDYPWRNAGYGLSPLSYYYRQCVDFVAWRLNRDAGVTSAPWRWTWSNLTPNGGDASQWKSAWVKHGWPVSRTPVVGAVAWFTGDHVAYVHLIQGSNVVIEEYNGESSRAYAMRTVPISSVADFLYPPR